MSTYSEHLPSLPGLRRRIESERGVALLLVLPTIITVFLVTIGPMLWSLWLSFHRWNPGSINPEPTFNGISNFVWVFTNERFWNSVVNLVYYSGVGVLIQVVLGTMLALALYNCIERRWLRIGLITLILMPMMYAPIVIGQVWELLFLPSGGAINGLLALVGLPAVPWLESRWLGLTALLIADTWQWVGLPLIIVYGGRVSIPDSRYEAADIFGASRWMQFRYITFPELKNLIAIAVILRFMDSYKFFDKLFVMTGGGPGTATEVPTFFTYQIGLQQFQIGRAATLTWVLAVGSILVMFLFWRQIRQGTTV